MATTDELEVVRRRAQEAASVYERTLSADGVNADDLQHLLGFSSHRNGDDRSSHSRLRRSRSDDTMLRDNSETSDNVAGSAGSPEAVEQDGAPATNHIRQSGPLGGIKGDRNSFFALLAAHRNLDALRDQRSPGPPLGRQYFSPGELADEDSSQPSSPSSTSNSRSSPLHWLVKMGMAEHDGNLPISIRRPKREERAPSPSPKRGKVQSSALFKKLRSASSEMSLDKSEAERLKKVRP